MIDLGAGGGDPDAGPPLVQRREGDQGWGHLRSHGLRLGSNIPRPLHVRGNQAQSHDTFPIP